VIIFLFYYYHNYLINEIGYIILNIKYTQRKTKKKNNKYDYVYHPDLIITNFQIVFQLTDKNNNFKLIKSKY